MSPSEIERIKLLAASLDRGCTSCFTIGIITPAAGLIYNVANFAGSADALRLTFGLLGWTICGIGPHYLARRVLGGLDR